MKKLLILFIAIPIISFGQVTLEEDLKKKIIIEGNVSDVNGMPLAGATIFVKGVSNVIKTNFDGDFSLKAEEGTVLIINCSGFKTKEITIGNRVKITIILEDKVKSKPIKTLTKSDIRKKKREDNKAKRGSQSSKNTEDLDDWLLKSAGRTAKTAIIRNRNN